MHFSSLPYMLQALPISSFVIDHLNNIWWREKLWISLLCHFFQPAFIFHPFSVQIFCSAPCSQTPQSMYFPWYVRRSFKPIKNNRWTYSFYILIFTVLDRKRQDNRSWTEWQLAFLEFNVRRNKMVVIWTMALIWLIFDPNMNTLSKALQVVARHVVAN
jgi:hypothetical protein